MTRGNFHCPGKAADKLVIRARESPTSDTRKSPSSTTGPQLPTPPPSTPTPSGVGTRRNTGSHGPRSIPERIRLVPAARPTPRCPQAAREAAQADSQAVPALLARVPRLRRHLSRGASRHRGVEFLPGDLRIDAEYIDGRPQLVGVCHHCHVIETARQQNSWKRQKEPHPGVLP